MGLVRKVFTHKIPNRWLILVPIGLFCIYFLTWKYHDPIRDHRFSCQDLPSHAGISRVVKEHSADLKTMFADFAACRNNVVFCEKRENCLEIAYDDEYVRYGYTKLSWEINPRCRASGGYDFVLRYTSGEENTVFHKYLGYYDKLWGVPVRYVNY